jgi:phosphate uptake regulator
MRRKLIQHGLSSLTVSLPHEWVKEKRLKKHDEVEVEVVRGNILVAAETRRERKSIDIDITDASPMIRRIIGATFKAGYDEVNIRFASYDELKSVQELIREQFSGFEIMRQTKNTITIRNVAQADFGEFDNVLRRFFHILCHMANETAEAAAKDDHIWLKNTTLMKIESDKHADYCRRAINAGHEADVKRSAPLYTIIEQLEKAVDRYRDLCDHVSTHRIKLDAKTKRLLAETAAFVAQFQEAYYSFDVRKMVALGRKKERLQKDIDALATSCAKHEQKTIMLLDRIVNLVFDLNGPLMAARI